MNNREEIAYWNSVKGKLQEKYPQLTNADLFWRDGTKDDLLILVAERLDISKRELVKILDNL